MDIIALHCEFLYRISGILLNMELKGGKVAVARKLFHDIKPLSIKIERGCNNCAHRMYRQPLN
jgi:hypothetical protein